MPILDLLTTERVRTEFVARDKASLLRKLSGLLGKTPAERNRISTALAEREALGSTGLGHGVAIPHGRIAGIDKARAAFVRLARPIEFGSVDGVAVDLVAALVVPVHLTDQHLQLLAELAEAFSDAHLMARFRRAADSSALRAELAEFGRNRNKGPAWTD
jgi:PTS system nitrogen regulatory IIA component